MAHGFLAPNQRDSSDTWLDKKLDDALSKGFKKLEKAVRGGISDALFNFRTKTRSPKPYSSSKGEDATPLQRMLEGSSVKKALSAGSDAVNPTAFGGELAKSTGIVRLRPSDNPIIDVEATPVNDNFFAKSAEFVGSGSGSREIVQAIDRLSAVTRNLVAATDDQTNSQILIAQEQQQQADKLARKSIAAAEASSFTNDDFSSNSAYQAIASGGKSMIRRGGFGGGGLGMGLLGGKVGARKALAGAIGRRGGARVGRRMGIALGGRLAGKSLGKIGGKGIAKSLGKKIPLVGLGLGAIFAAQRAMQGDFLGAGLELASGAASTVPGIGTAGSVGIDAALMARDMTSMDTGGTIYPSRTNEMLNVGGRMFNFNEPGNEEVIRVEKDGADSGLKIGEGILEAQRRNKSAFAKLQAEGFKQYYDRGHGWDGFFGGIKEFLGVFKIPGFGKIFDFGDKGDENEDNNNTINSSEDYGEKMNGFFSKRKSGDDMKVNADGVFQSKIGGVVTKVGEHKDLGKYVDIVNEERGVTERIADISEVMPGIEVGASISPGDPIAKGNDAGIVHYEIRNGGNVNPEKYKAKFGHRGTQDPNKFLEGINSDSSLNNVLLNSNGDSSNDLNATSSEVALAGQAAAGTIINNIISSSDGALPDGSTTVSNQVAFGASNSDMGANVLSNLAVQTLVG